MMRYAFNVLDLRGCEVFVALSRLHQLPLIVQVSHKVALKSDVNIWRDAFIRLREKYQADVWLNLDHARDMDLIHACIKSGWDMVVFDGAHLPLIKNLALTRRIVKEAHSRGMRVEAVLGNFETDDAGASDPLLVQEFVNETDVDYLGLPFGTKHGFHDNVKVDVDAIRKYHSLLDVNLSLHGGSGLDGEVIVQCIEAGIKKINFSTEVKLAYFKAFQRLHFTDFDDFKSRPFEFEKLLKEELEILFLNKLHFLEGAGV